MPKQDQPTLADLVQVLDDGMTLGDILRDLGWIRKERERHRLKAARKRKAKKTESPPPAPGDAESPA